MVKVKLLRPLDGREIGATAEYPEDDAKDLAARGVVELVGPKPAPKAEPASANKAKPAPANKAARAKKEG